jgi:cytosine deaminase
LGLSPSELRDPATLPVDSRLRTALVKASPLAFSLRISDFRQPNAALKNLLSELVASTPRASNAVAYIDPFGNLISAFADRFDVSPISTALMNLVQSYFRTRFMLMGDPKTNELAKKYLTTPKYGTLVFLRALAPNAATSVKDIGIYDLSIEGEAYQPQTGNWQYYLEPTTGTEEEFLALIKQMKSADGAAPKRIIM